MAQVTGDHVPVGGRRIEARVDLDYVAASDVTVHTTEQQSYIRFGWTLTIVPHGSDREQQLIMLAAIGDNIREQAKEQLAALHAAEEPTLFTEGDR